MSFTDALLLCHRVLPGALIGEGGWEQLLARGGRLPPSAGDAMFGFECPLDSADATADLLLSVPPDGRFTDALIRDGASGGLKAGTLARFLRDRKRPGSPFAGARGVDLAALEYDIAGVAHASSPGVFLRSADDSGYADAGLLTTAVAMAVGWRGCRDERDAVANLLAALPPGAAVRWAGAFPSRKPRALRLLIRGLGGGVATFLARMGWAGDGAAIERIAAAFRDRGVDNHVLALDMVDARVAPGIGLELSRRGRSSGWEKALGMLARRRWCVPGKVDALKRAAGSERFYSRAGVRELHYGLHHVKLALRGRGGTAAVGGIWDVKAYIGCVLRTLR